MDQVDDSQDPFIGKMIAGKYRITARIGSGGMSGIYRAEHSFMNRDVALKILPPQLAVDPTSRRRFEHEAKIASQINHPNAVILFDFGVDEDLPFLVMELIEGKTLKEVTMEGKRLPLSKIADINDQVCGALQEAHGLGIIHRDIKPTNIMLRGASERVKVLDFGIAKIVNNSMNQASDLTIAGTIVGTPHYMSPEQGLCKELDLRSDIYSLGVVLYELISGNRPFDAPSTLELLVKHVNTAPPMLRSMPGCNSVSPDVEKVVMKCLEKDPAKRFQTMDELADAFRSAVNSISSADTRTIRTSPINVGGKFGALQLALLVILITVPLLYLGFRSRSSGAGEKTVNGTDTGSETEKGTSVKTAETPTPTSIPAGPDKRMVQMFMDDLGSKDENVRYRAAEELLKIGTAEAAAAVDKFRVAEEKRKDEERAQQEAEKQRLIEEQKKEEARLAEQKRQDEESAKKLKELETLKRQLEEVAKKAEEERLLAEKKAEEMKALAERQADEARRAAAEKSAVEKASAEKEAAEKAKAAKIELERANKQLEDQKNEDQARRDRDALERAKREADRRQREADLREAQRKEAERAARAVTTVPHATTSIAPEDDTAPEDGQKKKRKRCGPNWCM